MPRFFLSVSYMGTRYAGSQIQENAMTVQGELEKAMGMLFRENISLTGSSRTDAGVHAAKNFFHFDWMGQIKGDPVYQLNAILPSDIAVLDLLPVHAEAHCRFDAISREYEYCVYNRKDPFFVDRGWFYPYPLDLSLLNCAAKAIVGTHDFSSFAKRNAQVFTHICTITKSEWIQDQGGYAYRVEGNRFLRGMVRALVATMTRVGRGRISVEEFVDILKSGDSSRADFSAPAQGLLLNNVRYDSGLFPHLIKP